MLDTRITAVVALPTIHVFTTQTVAEFYPRRSIPNLDKSDFTGFCPNGIRNRPRTATVSPHRMRELQTMLGLDLLCSKLMADRNFQL